MKSTILSLFLLTGLSAAAPTPSVTLTAKNALSTYPGAALLGSQIEGCSVDASGVMHAVNSTHLLSLVDSTVILQGQGAPESFFASSRYTLKYGYLVGDAAAHGLVVGETSAAFMTEASMLQPNDFTVSADETKIYLSGMNYTANTGDLWVYDVTAKNVSRINLAGGEATYRINGIELCPTGKNLFFTSAQNNATGNGMEGAKVMKLPLGDDGMPTGPPTVAIDLYQVLEKKGLDPKTAGMDPDGMRMDSKGTLFMTLNAFKRVLMWDVTKDQGEAKVIELETVEFPTNLELGGEDGMTLVVVGRCGAEGQQGCVDAYRHDTPGRAWSNLQTPDAPACT
jgi:sugar lactone lactonase YvrE